jgi:prophage regulatory protein
MIGEQRRHEEKREHRRQLREQRRQRAVATIAASGRPRVMPLAEVEMVTGKKKSSIYDDPSFPKPVATGPRSAGWIESEVYAWLDAKIAERDQRTAIRALPLDEWRERRSAQRSPATVSRSPPARSGRPGGKRHEQ